jgi:pyruvate dehydrogenase E2 component (dihydrolipoamide acetyltransferase)
METDEGLVEVESPLAGKLREILVGEGKTVAVNTPIALVGESGAAAPSEVKPAVTGGKGDMSKPSGKVVPIVMPKAGQTMEEGTLLKWHVQPGAMIQKGQVIFEIETDKAAMDVEATDGGRLARIVLAEGQSIKVLEPVAYLADNDADVNAFIAGGGWAAAESVGVGPTAVAGTGGPHPSPLAEHRQRTSGPAVVSEGGQVKASPAARRIAGQRGIDLAAIGAGSGPGGRILSSDVPAMAPAAPVAAPAAEGVVRKRMSQMRRAIAKNLSLSKQTIPHFYIKLTINAEPLYSFYQGEKAKYPCSINDVVVMACAKAMMEFPQLRSRIENDEILEFPSANIGIAVGMEEGLVVPVLVGAEKMSLKQIGAESKRMANAARAGKLEGIGKGLFTITNMGMFGVEEFSAIINPPEAAILAVGAIREAVIVSGGTLRPGRVMTLTLSTDHRVIDGLAAARFLNRLKEILEWPGQLV